MKMRQIKIGILVCLILILTGCSKESKDMTSKQQEIVIPVSFLVNPDTGENENEELVDEFNKEYEGTYRVEVEWVIDTVEGYRARMKNMNALDTLPAIITDVGFDADFYELLVRYDRLVDLKPYIEENEEWNKAFGQTQREKYEENGKIYLSPSTDTSLAYAGFYYNKELLHKIGVDEFPNTWDGFFECLDTLKENEIVPLSLHGGNSYWTTLLIATAYMARNDKGLAFLQEQYPESYQNESVKQMLELIKRLYDDYAASDAIEIERVESLKRFLEGQEAITANGGWMIEDLTEKEKSQIGFASFPENLMMIDTKMSAWAAVSGYSDDITKGALEFLKFRALRDKKKAEKYFTSQMNSLVEQEYKQAVEAVQRTMPNYQLQWENEIQENFFVEQLPLYVEGKMTTEELLELLDHTVNLINQEK